MHQNCCESKDWGQFLVLVWREKTATVNTERTAVSTTTKTSIPVSYLQPGRWFHYTRLPESRTHSLLRCAEDVTLFCMDSCLEKNLCKGKKLEGWEEIHGTPFMFCRLYLSHRTATSWNVFAGKWSSAQWKHGRGEGEGNALPLSRLGSNVPLDENLIFSDCQILKLCSQF